MDTRVPGPAARLTDLPTELLGIICLELSLKERVCLSITCRALLHSLASSADAWGTLDFLDKRSRGKLDFILPWLAHRRRNVQRLRLDFNDVLESEVPHVAAKLPSFLEGSPLVELSIYNLALPVEEATALQWLGSCTGLTSLLLCGCGLRCLPDTLKQLPALAQLSLADDFAEANWGPLQQLTVLTSLYLYYCRLAALPAELAALPALEVLSLQGNPKLGDAAEDAWAPLARCSSLTSLYLGDIPFTQLPQALAALAPTLVELDLSPEGNDEVTWFHDETCLGPLYMLTGLTWLDLTNCMRYLSMPEELSCLVRLQVLDMSYASYDLDFASEAHFLRHLTALTYLSLRQGNLEDLPEELSCLVALQTLDLSYNPLNIEGLPTNVLCHLTALTWLGLGSCWQEDLPEEISHLQALKHLDFGNRMEEHQEHAISHAGWQHLRRLTALTYLDLTDCKLERLPPELAELRFLAELDLCWNSLLGGDAPDAAEKWAVLEQLTALTNLNAGTCELYAVPAAFAALPQLQVLTLTFNPDLGRGGMEALRPLVRMTALQHLDLGYCSLPEELEEDAIPFPLHRLEGWAERIEGLLAWESRELKLG